MNFVCALPTELDRHLPSAGFFRIPGVPEVLKLVLIEHSPHGVVRCGGSIEAHIIGTSLEFGF